MVHKKRLFLGKKTDSSRFNPSLNTYFQNYIKENLSKGYSIEKIKITLVKYGLKESLVNRLFRIYFAKNLLSKSMFFILPLIVIVGLLFLKPATVGYVTYTESSNYSEEIDLAITQDGSHEWDFNKGNLSSVKISGSVSREGNAKVFLAYDDSQYLVFDSSQLTGLTPLTSVAPLNETNNSLLTSNLTNNSEIILDLKYKSGTDNDENDDGVVTNDGIIDFTVEDSKFIGNESNLCTKWEVYNGGESTFVCYGGERCCNFIELSSSSDNWDDTFNLNYGRYGAGSGNSVSAQVLYVDYSLDPENPYSDIRYSELGVLNAIFEDVFFSFEDVCLETCLLPNLDLGEYSLIFEIDNTTLNVDSLSYIASELVNLTNVTIVDESLSQDKAEINKPVKWTKKVKLSGKKKDLVVEIPQADEISVRKIQEGIFEEVEASIKVDGKTSSIGAYNLVTDLEKIKKDKKKNEIIFEDEVEEVEIEYFTEAPTAVEEVISEHIKQVTISSDIHYEDIFAYSSLPKETSKKLIKLIWIINGSRQDVDFNGKDNDGNGLIDTIEWVVPHLSNQTYEIIVITKAEHLDSDKEFISDIYDYVKEQDGNWSENIIDGEYVRVTFEENLTNEKDITVYVRNNLSLESSIEVYYFNSSEKITEFSNMLDEGYYKVYLTDMVGSHDSFDLKVVGGSLEFDHIIDPTVTIEDVSLDAQMTNITPEINFTHLNISEASPYDSLVGYWSFDQDLENLQNFTSIDYSGNDIDGTANGSAVVNETDCMYGDCLQLDGSGDYVNLGNDASLEGMSDLTISAWVKLNHLGTNQRIVSNWGLGGTERAYVLGIDNINNPVFGVDREGDSNVVTASDFTVTTGIWYHIVGVYNNSADTVYIYINGNLNNSNFNAGGNIASGSYDTNIGAEGENSSLYHLNGSIDEVMIFSAALESDQVLDVYNNISARFKASGRQVFDNQSVLNISTGYDKIQVSADYEALFGSSINLSVGYFNGSWLQTGEQVFDGDNTFYVGSLTTNLTLNFSFISNNLTNPFYSPVLSSAVNALSVNISFTFYAPTEENTSQYVIEGTVDDNLSNGSSYSDDQFLNFTHPTLGQRLQIFAYFSNGSVDISDLVINATDTITVVDVSSADNVGGNHTLFLPNYHGSAIFICPDATDLAGVNPSCSNIIRFAPSEFGSWKSGVRVSVDGGYYKIENLTGSGVGEDNNSPTINFVDPTIDSGGVLQTDWVEANVSVNDSSNISTLFDIDNSIIAWWRMDDVQGSGPEEVLDYTGRNNGTAIGVATRTINGTLGYGYSFIGNDTTDYVDGGSDSSLAISGAITVSSWVKPGLTGTHQGIYARGVSTGVNQCIYLILVSGTAGRLTVCNGSDILSSGSVAVNTGEWNHVVGTYNSTHIATYVNGVKSTTTQVSGEIKYNSSLTMIGKTWGNGYPFNGTIDDVIIFNRSLSYEEILGLYANKSTESLYHNFTDLVEGAHTIKAYSQDTAGNVNYTETRNFSVDTIYPTINITPPTPAGGSTVSTNNIFVNVTANDSATNVSTFIDFNGGLVNWWRMDDIDGSGNPDDYMGANDATMQNAANQVDDGKIGKGFEFYGNQSWLSATRQTWITRTGTYSLAMWVRVNEDKDNRSVLIQNSNSASDRNCLWVGYIDGNYIATVGYYDGGGWTGASGNITPNEWHHIVGVNDGGALTMYVDGVEKTDTFTPYCHSITTWLYFGRHSNNFDYNFNGTMDDIMIFNRTLSTAEVVGLYANQSYSYLNVTYTGLSAGDHTFKAYTQDSAGNLNSSEMRTVTIEVDAPSIIFGGNTANDSTIQRYADIWVNVTTSDPSSNISTIIDFDSSLVGWFRMDDINGTGEIVEYFGRHNGTSDGGSVQTSSGRLGAGYDFNGSSNVTFPGAVLTPGINTISFGGWMKWNSIADHTVWDIDVPMGQDNGSDLGYQIWTSDNPTVYVSCYDGQDTLGTGYTISTATWYHVLCVYNSTNMMLYVDGIRRDIRVTTGGTDLVDDAPFSLGGYVGTPGSVGPYPFNGTLDDVVVFNRTLSDEEILGLYANTSSRYLTHNFTGLGGGSSYN